MLMDEKSLVSIDQAKEAALRVLLHNARGPFQGLPRTAGWGYPEPYTRDLMISALGFLATGNEELADALRRTLVALATNQTPRGHIPSLAHDPADRGASDTTPLFLFGLALYRKSANQPEFLDEAAQKALKWMQYQSPDDMVMVSQLPTSDWRDEQWVMGYGLYVNTLVYAYLVLYGEHESAGQLRELMNRLEVRGEAKNPHEHEGLVVPSKPYYALYSYKLFNSDRFDLLGNSLAILTGIASPDRARDLVAWVEAECEAMRDRGELAVDLPPCLFPYILRQRSRLAAAIRAIQPARRVSQRGCLAVCLRLLCGGMRGGGADGAGEAEAVGADRTGEALARERGGVGFQRVDQGADRPAQRTGLADLVGRYVPLRC